jgi:hypothetical protein
MIAYSVARRFFIFPLSACLVGIFQQMIRRTEKRKGSITLHPAHPSFNVMQKFGMCVRVYRLSRTEEERK